MNTAKMNTITRMKCLICGHIYDPKKGERGIPAGIAFTDLPEDWCCPVCKAPKTKFTEVK